PKPALAFFYLGHIEYLGENINNAEGNYNLGLKHNAIHFKCLLGLYDLFFEMEAYTNAYEIVKKLSKYFPSNPERMSQAIHLAVRTKNLDDMGFYYDTFKELEERPSEMVNYMGAGLYVAGK